MPLGSSDRFGFGSSESGKPEELCASSSRMPLIIVDAGVGTASDAAIAMELGADAILMNTAIAEADQSGKDGESYEA